MSDEEALELVSRQGGIGKAGPRGPKAPKTIQQFLHDLNGARKRGYGIASETYEAGMTSMAAVIRHPVTGLVVGIVSLAGPTSRLSDARLKELAPALLEAATDMGAATLSSPYFKRSLRVAPVAAVVQPVEPKRKGRPRAA
jgi:DNA-binding IclR family transcriptional regulator